MKYRFKIRYERVDEYEIQTTLSYDKLRDMLNKGWWDESIVMVDGEFYDEELVSLEVEEEKKDLS